MSTKEKAIILFNHRHIDNPEFRTKLIDFCTEHFDIIKIVQAKNKHHFKALRKVIKAAISWKGNITIITDKETFDLSTNILACSVLGTLSLAEIADVCIYEKQRYTTNQEIKFKFLPGRKNQGLHTAIDHLREILACMSEQENKLNKLSNAKKAVILLHQPYWYSNRELQQTLVDLCVDNDLSVTRIIKSKNEYDANIFYRLIHVINKEHRPVTMIMEENEYRSIDNILTCSIVGALLLFGVVDFATYKNDISGNVQLKFIDKDDVGFFQVAQKNISQLMDFRQKQLQKKTTF